MRDGRKRCAPVRIPIAWDRSGELKVRIHGCYKPSALIRANMTIKEQVKKLTSSIEEFTKCVISLPENTFLHQFSEWSPRDVLAHLIGWNRYTVEGGEQIKKGETPFYFTDSGEDFSKVNAVLVTEYSSKDRRTLVNELKASSLELQGFLLSLDPIEWETDYGIRYEGGPVTIKNTVDALINEYVQHSEQIEKWVKGVDTV